MNHFMFIANQGDIMLRLFSAIYPSILRIHYFCCNVIRFLARTKGSKRDTLWLHNVDLKIGAEPHKMCCQKHALSKTYCQKQAVQDEKEAGNHKADCLWHIVQECRHIVFNLAHVSLAKSQGCISCGILVSGIWARGASSEHMENMEMFSCSPT